MARVWRRHQQDEWLARSPAGSGAVQVGPVDPPPRTSPGGRQLPGPDQLPYPDGGNAQLPACLTYPYGSVHTFTSEHLFTYGRLFTTVQASLVRALARTSLHLPGAWALPRMGDGLGACSKKQTNDIHYFFFFAAFALPPWEAMSTRSLCVRAFARAGPPVFPPFLPRAAAA